MGRGFPGQAALPCFPGPHPLNHQNLAALQARVNRSLLSSFSLQAEVFLTSLAALGTAAWSPPLRGAKGRHDPRGKEFHAAEDLLVGDSFVLAVEEEGVDSHLLVCCQLIDALLGAPQN